MEEAYSYDQGYTPWNFPPYQHHAPQYNAYQSNEYGDVYYGYKDPSPRYPPSQNGIKEALQLLCQERKELWKAQKRIDNQVTTLQLSIIRLMIQSTNSNFNNSSIASQSLNFGGLPSQPLSNPRGSIPTLFRCANQEGKEDALLHDEDVESFNHEKVHECLEEVEEKNEDQEVEDKDKMSNGMEIVHSASSEATPPKLPSKLHFEWINYSDMNFLGPQHYGLLETDSQLKALGGVLDKKEMDSLELDESRFITCGKPEFKVYSGHLHKLHKNRAKVGALSLRKHLGP
ncbi:hypothetical protein PIB30_067677 [Stylosanthes scabra]|uniref:Uncharacterized protein n=1 Tax=Stylosanthes scabra TaxID=79078 RepID=A0ABU6RN32_9FABA|nr:hypothetical protein [Stylosanthes scabra]